MAFPSASPWVYPSRLRIASRLAYPSAMGWPMRMDFQSLQLASLLALVWIVRMVFLSASVLAYPLALVWVIRMAFQPAYLLAYPLAEVWVLGMASLRAFLVGMGFCMAFP